MISLHQLQLFIEGHGSLRQLRALLTGCAGSIHACAAYCWHALLEQKAPDLAANRAVPGDGSKRNNVAQKGPKERQDRFLVFCTL
jgi:hypothetical protein